MNIIKKLEYKFCGFKKREKLVREMGVKIGNNCEIYSNVSFGSEPYLVEIGDNVRLAMGVKITTHDGGLWVLRNNGKLRNADKFGRVKIGSNVHVGLNTIIMPGVTIGDNVIIGCGAVVTKDIPSESVAVGVPAKVIESIDEYYRKVKNKVIYSKNLAASDKKDFVLKNT
ncbi:acyltransferase [Candidatus Saccharibacteria bacterium]|nr:acyltransferase [Candidatus Saccharibacteria bacterium]